jgi:hypothetical protein
MDRLGVKRGDYVVFVEEKGLVCIKPVDWLVRKS